jgi:ABC-2 type transport system permease protein
VSARRQFRRIASFELRVLMADRTLWLTLGLLLLLIVYAMSNGIAQTAVRDASAVQTARQDQTKRERLVDRVRRMMAGQYLPEDPFANPVDPTAVGGGMGAAHAVLPSAPLAPLAFGQSDMQPNEYRVTTRSRVSFMQDAEIENPWNLLNGRFDLAFVMTWLLPLLVFASSYNLLSAEREQGTLRLLLSQPLHLRTLLLAKLSVRAALLLGTAVLIPIVLLLLFRSQSRTSMALVDLLQWAALVIAYGSFWFALCAWVNTLGRTSAFNALVLIGSWVLLVLVLPLLVNLLVSVRHPAPSRIELATQTRIVTTENLSRLQERFGSEYVHVSRPDVLLPKDGRLAVSERMRAFFLHNQALDAQLDGLLDRFDVQLERQQRLVDRWGFLSPAITVHEGMAALAGNGAQRYLEFQRQVKAHHESWKAWFEPRVLEGLAITTDDLQRLPRWQWRETRAAATPLRLLQLALIAGVLLALALHRLRRFRPV